MSNSSIVIRGVEEHDKAHIIVVTKDAILDFGDYFKEDGFTVNWENFDKAYAELRNFKPILFYKSKPFQHYYKTLPILKSQHLYTYLSYITLVERLKQEKKSVYCPYRS